METYILNEGVLNDDTLLLPDENKVFKGQYIGIIEYWTYQNCWSNNKHVIKFRTENRLQQYLKKHYPNFEY